MSNGYIVVFSGLDGAGKSTQIDLLQRYLDEQGQATIYLWTRGGYTRLFLVLKDIARWASRGKVVPTSGHSGQRTQAFRRPLIRRLWLVLAILDLSLVYIAQLRWWRSRGKFVLCDRYLWDTLLDFQLNFPQEQVERWWLWRLLQYLAPRPDAAFLLTIPVAESLRRSQLKQEPFPDTPDTLHRRYHLYQQFVTQKHWLVLNGLRPTHELANEIRATIGLAALQSVDVA